MAHAWKRRLSSLQLHVRLELFQRLIKIVVDHYRIKFVLGIELLTGSGKSTLNRILRVGPPTSNPPL